ncbi:MAG TPA: CmpA/NrtA family ABC transporter substrate-binding protein [Methylocystis sp.]|nr:CmpA/NrtA family ABC transporter substrate-binding protein [Methylocystis sp.]
MTRETLRIGFIPLVDAAGLIAAADLGFAAAEGLKIELVREVSWSNIRDRLALGHLDAAHVLAPMVVASRLKINQLRAPLAAIVNLALNGNAITVAPALFAQLSAETDGDIADPAASAAALERVVHKREARGEEPLTFGMTFPFSTHNYLLRHWMAAGGIDPDRDLRLVVLPPPLMADSLAQGLVDGFCVGAPWSSVAVASGLGVILHFGCEIFSHAPEKVLAMRESAISDDRDRASALIRALVGGARHAEDPANRREIAALLARPDRVGVDAELISRTLEGRLRIDVEGATRRRDDYLILARDGACRPEPIRGAWLYAQALRWGQARFEPDDLAAAKSVMRADLFDGAAGGASPTGASAPGAFSGEFFDEGEIQAYVNGFAIGTKI